VKATVKGATTAAVPPATKNRSIMTAITLLLVDLRKLLL